MIIDETTDLNEDGKVRVIFEKGFEHGMFRDALYFTQEEYALLSEVEIEDMKQQRYDNWVAIVTEMSTPPVEDVVV